MTAAANLEQIRHHIREACEKSGRNPDDITLIGVTKYVTIERTEEIIQAGVENLGENRLEGFLEKYQHFTDRVNWHFIGTLQSRKVKDVINQIDMLHSLDRNSLAKEINKRVNEQLDCFIQVNVSGEVSKHGLDPEEVVPFVEEMAAYENVRIIGLMTMAPHINDELRLREIFRTLAKLRDEVSSMQLSHAPCAYLSMGMSNDYRIAIEEGATHVRIGSSLTNS
ncbi:YggS family pyridoxal phosphate-dependent enzyme [Lentibacillus sediminis]|uniref:YggS family pyridoxal phosphate-dependent enzyme n=1 Tax=Lentibacillus sediminis TaxID=1940529 RepID=UPI000C1C23E0|nr:YggS family pyridoxal phosphate-dependent enzyme [Lentibacillus sediminis]